MQSAAAAHLQGILSWPEFVQFSKPFVGAMPVGVLRGYAQILESTGLVIVHERGGASGDWSVVIDPARLLRAMRSLVGLEY